MRAPRLCHFFEVQTTKTHRAVLASGSSSETVRTRHVAESTCLVERKMYEMTPQKFPSDASYGHSF